MTRAGARARPTGRAGGRSRAAASGSSAVDAVAQPDHVALGLGQLRRPSAAASPRARLTSTSSSSGRARRSAAGRRRPVSPSSPTGRSRLVTVRAASRTSSTCSSGSSASAAISSSVGSRPSRAPQLALGADDLALALADVHRDADRARLVGQAALDRLADPEGGVGGELEALAVVELLGRADQAEDALLDQVEQRQLLALVLLGDRDDEAQVGVDHPLLGLEVALLDALGQLDLLVRGQQRVAADLVEEQLEGVGGRAGEVAVAGSAVRLDARRGRSRR